MDLYGCKYSYHCIEGISQVLPKSTATSYSKKMFHRPFSTVQPSNSSFSKGEEVADSNMTLSEQLQNIMDKYNEAEKGNNTELSQYIEKNKLVVF